MRRIVYGHRYFIGLPGRRDARVPWWLWGLWPGNRSIETVVISDTGWTT